MSRKDNTKLPDELVPISKELIQLLKTRKLAIFCGAGICLNPPSNLPLAGELRQEIVNTLLPEEELSDESRMLLEKGIVTIQRDFKLSDKLMKETRYYPFEAFLQTVNTNASIIETIVKIYQGGEPNKAHTLLAELLKQGYVCEIMTTNFDTKIEVALEQLLGHKGERWKKNEDFTVIYKESDFLKADFSRIRRPIIWKIHGTIGDSQSLRTTLKTIARRELREARSKILRYFFQKADQNILIIGYSCSDEFDINPILNALDSETHIYLIQHLPKQSNKLPGVYTLKYPFNRFQGKMICCNTDNLLEDLWKYFIGKTWKDYPKSKAWKHVILKWSNDFQEGQRTFTAARVLQDIQEYSQAESLYQQSLETFQEIGDEVHIASTYHQLARLQEERGRYKDAYDMCMKGLKISRRLDNKEDIVLSLQMLGRLYHRWANYKEAERRYKQGLKIAKKSKYKPGVAISYHQLARLYEDRGNFKKARKLYERSLKISQQLGDQINIIRTRHQLAFLLQLHEKLDYAETLYRQNLNIAERLGDQKGIAQSLHHLGMLEHIRGNPNEAKDFYQQSRAIKERIGDKAGLVPTLLQLAMIQDDRGNFDCAKPLYQQSFEILKQLDDQAGIAVYFHHLAWHFLMQEKYDEAENFCNESLVINEKLGHKRRIAHIFVTLGQIAAARESFKLAIKRYKIAEKMFRELKLRREVQRVREDLKRIRLKSKSFQ